MTKPEILEIVNPKNERLSMLAYDLYIVTLIDNSKLVGCFHPNSVIAINNENIWKIFPTKNPINAKYKGIEFIMIDGKEIKDLKRLNTDKTP